MARHLAIRWNFEEIFAVVAEVTRGGIVWEQAFRVPLSDGAIRPDDREIASRLKKAFSEHGVHRAETTVALQRNDVEIRHFILPPAPDDELPTMARFGAQREFNAMTEAWPFDYAPLTDDPDKPRPVLAATVNPELLERIETICEKAGHKIDHLTVEPCGTAITRWRSDNADPAAVELLVGLSGREADLIVSVDRRVVFLRAAKLPADPLGNPNNVLGLGAEIRRTMMAAHSELGERRIERIVLRGCNPQHEALAASLAEQLSMPVELFDAAGQFELGRETRSIDPCVLEPYTPLLGLIAEETDLVTTTPFDFICPKQPPAPPSRKNHVVLAILVVFLLAVVLGGALWRYDKSLQDDIVILSNEKREAEKERDTTAEEAKRAQAVEKWERNSVNWLNEMEWLADKLSGSQEVMVTQLQAASQSSDLSSRSRASNSPIGQVKLVGRARSYDTFPELEGGLRDDTHRVVPGSKLEDTNPPYFQRFDMNIIVLPAAKVATSKSGEGGGDPSQGSPDEDEPLPDLIDFNDPELSVEELPDDFSDILGPDVEDETPSVTSGSDIDDFLSDFGPLPPLETDQPVEEVPSPDSVPLDAAPLDDSSSEAGSSLEDAVEADPETSDIDAATEDAPTPTE
jgi:Tfp pilus assembly PilM family ATPase